MKKLKLVFPILFLFVLVFGIFGFGFLIQDKMQNKSVNFEFSTGEVEKLGELLIKSGYLVKLPIIVKEDLISATISGITVIFSKDKDLNAQVRALQLVLSRPTMGSKKIVEIDLRFNKVVLRFKD